jgi:hypothetical protein
MDLESPDRPGLVTASASRPGPPSVEELAARVKSLEDDRERFLHAMKGAVAMLLDNPMTSTMMPKKMKEDLREYLEKNGNGASA